MGSITPPGYPTLFLFEVGQWWDYAMLVVSGASLLVNVVVFGAHLRRVVALGRNPLRQEVYSDTPTYAQWVREMASPQDKGRIAARLGRTPAEAGYL